MGKTRLVIARYFLLDTSCRLYKLGTFRYHENSFYVTDIQHVHNKIQSHKKFGIKVAVQYSTVQYSTVQYSTVQYSTVQYSTVQYSTVQYSTVQYSTVQYKNV